MYSLKNICNAMIFVVNLTSRVLERYSLKREFINIIMMYFLKGYICGKKKE